MQTYLAFIEKAIIENNLCNAVILAAIGIFLASMLLCLLIRSRYRGALASLDTAFKNEGANHERDRVQLSDNLNVAHEKIQQQEAELKAQTHRIEQVESDRQAGADRTAVLELEIQQRNQCLLGLLASFEKELGLDTGLSAVADAALDDALWQRHGAAVAALVKRLHTDAQRQLGLEEILQTGQTLLAEKEAALETLLNTVNGQASHIVKMEQDFIDKLGAVEVGLSKLQTKHQSYTAYMGKLVWARMGVFNGLNKATHKIQQLEMALAAKKAYVEPVAHPESQPDVESVTHLESVAQLQGVKPSKPLFARFINAVKTDFGANKQTYAKDDTSPEINAVDDGQHTLRAEDALEEQGEAQQATVPAQREATLANPIAEADGSQPDVEHPATSKVQITTAQVAQGIKGHWFGLFKKQPPDTTEQQPPSPEDAPITVVPGDPMAGADEPPADGEQATPGNTAAKAAQVAQALKGQWSGLFKKQTPDATGQQPPSQDNPIEIPLDDEPMSKTTTVEQLKGFYQKFTSSR